MNATEVLAELLQLTQDNDRAGLESWNLPPNVARILPRLAGISAEIRQLELIVQRREAEEIELEQLALQLIQSAGLATARPTSDQSPDQPAAAAAAADA